MYFGARLITLRYFHLFFSWLMRLFDSLNIHIMISAVKASALGLVI